MWIVVVSYELCNWGKVPELYNVMELYFFENQLLILGYEPTIPPRQ